MDNIFEKSSKRLYMQRLLKRSKADRKTLIVVPITVIVILLEYACQVWHFNIKKILSDDIERIKD